MSGAYDVVVVGDGVAGLTAALFAARQGRTTAVFGSLGGGELLSIDGIEDFPGFPDAVAGYELCPALVDQAMRNGAEILAGEVSLVEAGGSGFLIRSDQDDVHARTVIVASGAAPRELGVPGEQRLRGRGVSHCASCDGPIFTGKVVGVVGGGDSALQEALVLARHAAKVVVLHRGDRFTAQETYVARIADSPAVEIHRGTVVDEVLGDDAVSGVRIRRPAAGEQQVLELAALFVYVGLEPRTAFVAGLVPLDERGRLTTDTSMRTATPGVFAAGSVRADAAGQAISSAGDGATAALSAHRYLVQADNALPAAPAGTSSQVA